MSRVRVESFTISINGYGAGPEQSARNPLGVGGEALHDWIVATRSWREMHGKEGGATGIDDDFAGVGKGTFYIFYKTRMSPLSAFVCSAAN